MPVQPKNIYSPHTMRRITGLIASLLLSAAQRINKQAI
ncbi:hypothetical protein PALI_b0173 [Pseudoalteromonas aliena SW19]|uniref:Uncharacterized protein n=1 Tax=Pseudoalteromonas aliena SW19 TaxID=1314866 RepID=A0ABR9E3R7_9GAMM|nr:hypothetical protein [Pseudoalteromonas aliena SW19]